MSVCKQNTGDDPEGVPDNSGSSQNIGDDLKGVPDNSGSSQNNSRNPSAGTQDSTEILKEVS